MTEPTTPTGKRLAEPTGWERGHNALNVHAVEMGRTGAHDLIAAIEEEARSMALRVTWENPLACKIFIPETGSAVRYAIDVDVLPNETGAQIIKFPTGAGL